MERKRIIRNTIYIGLAGCCVAIIAAIVWLVQVGGSQTKRNKQVEEGVSYVQAQVEKDAAQAQAIILAAKESRTAEEATVEIGETEAETANQEELSQGVEMSGGESDVSVTATTLSEEQERWLAKWKAEIENDNITRLTDEQKAAYRSRFTDCIVLGDSMAQAVLDYNFLEAINIVYRRGYAIGQMGEAVEEAAARLPRKIVFFTGLNDTNYYATAGDYVTAYSEKIAYLRSLLPDVQIYVCSLLPPSNELGAVRADLAQAPMYDAALEEMCAALNVTYINTRWMVNQALYMVDGIHFQARFYDIWLQYTAMMMGI